MLLTRSTIGALALSCLLGSLACDSAGPDVERRRGIIAGPDLLEVTLPSTVSVETPFAVSVNTYGNGCYSEGETEVTIDALTASVEPYDYVELRGVCTLELRVFGHETTITFTEAGVATVRMIGIRSPPDSTIVVEYAVTVTQAEELGAV
jgi:hypothetical protein